MPALYQKQASVDGLALPCYVGRIYEAGATENGQESRAVRFGRTALAAYICTNAVVSAKISSSSRVLPFVSVRFSSVLARERGETLRAATDTIQGYLSKPEGSGPFAAIVYLHGCAGLSENTRNDISQLMTGWGYVSLAVDSFATRGIRDECTHLGTPRLGDALALCPTIRYFPSSILHASPSLDHRRVQLLHSSWCRPIKRISSTRLTI